MKGGSFLLKINFLAQAKQSGLEGVGEIVYGKMAGQSSVWVGRNAIQKVVSDYAVRRLLLSWKGGWPKVGVRCHTRAARSSLRPALLCIDDFSDERLI